MKETECNEIDIIGLLKKVFAEKKTLGVFIACFFILGITVALNIQKKYTATVILAPEISGAGSMASNLSELASMVGVNINSTNTSIDAIYPEIYPDILASNDFITDMFDIKVKQKEDTVTKSYYTHIKHDSKIPFWSYPKLWLRKLFEQSDTATNNKLNPFMLTKEQYSICNIIRTNISCLVDKKTSVISLSVTDKDPLVAAIVVDTLQTRLQQYITMYRTKKARNDLDYIKKLFQEAHEQYKKSQQIYASYADANQDIFLEAYKAKRNEYENEMQLKYNNYTTIAQQLQLAKAKVQEKTPAFTIIQNATVPLQASSIPRSFIVIIFMLLGGISDCIWVLFLRNRWTLGERLHIKRK